MNPEEEAACLRQAQEEHVRRLRSLSEEQSLKIFFELMDMGRDFKPFERRVPVAPSFLIG